MHVCVLEINLSECYFDINLNLLYQTDIVTKWYKADKFHKTYRRGLLRVHGYTFGILENYHCWRFHGSCVMQEF